MIGGWFGSDEAHADSEGESEESFDHARDMPQDNRA